MKVFTVIKNEFGRIKEISLIHFIVAVIGALLVTGIAVIRPPLFQMSLSPVSWIPVFVVPVLVLTLFYTMVRKPERSVFRFIKYLYYIGAPAGLALLAGVFFDPTKAEYYSDNFLNRFLPGWIALWLLGIAAVYVLMRCIEYAAENEYEKGSFSGRVAFALAVMYSPQKTLKKQARPGKGKWIAAVLCMLMITVAVFIGTVTIYLHIVYSNMDFEAILFTLRFAAGGIALEDFIAGTAIFLIFAVISVYLCYNVFKCFKYDELVVADTRKGGKYTLVMNGRKRAVLIVVSVALFALCTAVFSRQTSFLRYVDMKLHSSTIYEEYYVKPESSIISFPEKKRNLIFIYVESMENSYASKDVGGSQDKNYISELTELAKDNVNFSNTEQLGGASVYVPSITNTMGSTVAQTSGIALNTKIFPKNSAVEFPATVRLEDILHDNGYAQLYIEGSKGEFSMYDKYVGRYEECRVFDRTTAAEQGYIDEGADYMWKWGIEDRKLFEITEELITEMSQGDKPFFVTMYTMDTHSFESGHRCPNCDSSISNDYLASVDCTSRQVADFVDWAKQQPFYENTTIILVGDHLGNEHTTMVDIDSGYTRTTYNCFINPAKKPANAKNRIFSSLDMFPTTLSAIGVEIKGDRLGLGTDLFSQKKTLCEELGEEEYMEQLERSSEYYEREFY